jgi:hypothetical protein
MEVYCGNAFALVDVFASHPVKSLNSLTFIIERCIRMSISHESGAVSNGVRGSPFSTEQKIEGYGEVQK